MSDVNKADKAAINYLRASSATAITITESGGVCSFYTGHKIDPGAVSIHWVFEKQAALLVKQARHDAGQAPSAGTTEAALHGAARDQGITLTAHSVAMGRAAIGAKKIDDYIGGLKGTGVLAGFNREYKKRRMAAAVSGKGFLTYSKALARLRGRVGPGIEHRPETCGRDLVRTGVPIDRPACQESC
jgi:hypothetical protein